MRRIAPSQSVPVLVAGAAGCVLAPPLMLAGIATPLRTAAALLLFAVAPGAALLPLRYRGRPGLDLALVVGTSLAISTLVAQAMLTAGLWSPAAATWLLAAACLVPIARRLRRVQRHPAEAGG